MSIPPPFLLQSKRWSWYPARAISESDTSSLSHVSVMHIKSGSWIYARQDVGVSFRPLISFLGWTFLKRGMCIIGPFVARFQFHDVCIWTRPHSNSSWLRSFSSPLTMHHHLSPEPFICLYLLFTVTFSDIAVSRWRAILTVRALHDFSVPHILLLPRIHSLLCAGTSEAGTRSGLPCWIRLLMLRE